MLQVLLLSLFSSSFAFTTHRYDTYNLGSYRPNTPHLDNIFEYAHGNGRRPVQYEYPKRHDGVVISDVLEGPVVDSDRRRVDTPYNYANQWNRQVPWNRVSVTEPTKLYNRFENSNQDINVNNPDTIVQQDRGNENQKYGVKNINHTEGVAHISTQSDDVKRSLVINEQRITWNNDHHSTSKDNANNITTRSINSDNYTNSLNVPSKQAPDNTNRTTKTNNITVYNNRNQPNNTNDNTKTTHDNEVTPSTYEQRTKAYEDDRWVWSNGEDQALETTTLFDLGDRAAFAGDGCPTGKTKVGTMCVIKD